MTDLIDMIASRLLSGLMQACEEMVVPPGTPPASDAVAAGTAVVQAGLPAPGEVLPLAVVAFAFVATATLIILRAQMASVGYSQSPEINVADASSA